MLNLLLMLFTAVAGLMLTVSAARKKEDENRKRVLRISSLIPALISVVVFLLTENLSAPMRFVNARTMWMLLFAVVQMALIFLSRKSKEEVRNEE